MHGGFVEFLLLSLHSVLLLGVFLAASAALLSFFSVINPSRHDLPWMAAISLGLGPALLSWFFTLALRLAPGKPPVFYILVVSLPALLLALIRLRWIVSELRALHALRRMTAWLPRMLSWMLFGTLGLLLVLLFASALFTPVTGNDALLYAQTSKLLAQMRSVEHYPFLDRQITGSFISASLHPLGYYNLLTFGYLLQGSTEYAGTIRLVAPWFALATAVALWHFAGREEPLAGPIAALLLLGTPMYFSGTAQFHIDAMRICTFFCAFVALHGHFRNPSLATALITGIAVGMAHFSHLSGTLTLPILVPLYLIASGLPPAKQLRYLAVIIVIGVSFVLPRWLDNMEIFGTIASDTLKLWTFPEIRFAEYSAIMRNIVTPLDKIIHGALAGFSKPAWFGFSYYLLLLAFVWFAWRNAGKLHPARIWREKSWFRPSPAVLSMWVLAGFYGIVVLSMLLGMNLIIKNSRYILTVQPFVAVVAAVMVGTLTREMLDSIFTRKMRRATAIDMEKTA